MQGIYMIRNTTNEKVYIGSAVDIEARWREHKSSLQLKKHHSVLLQRSFNKNGIESFEFSVIEIVTDLDELIPAEQQWIDHYRCYEPVKGYNICKQAGNSLGYKHTEESLRVMRDTRLKYTGERHPRYGAKLSEESRKKISENRKGKMTGTEHFAYGKPIKDHVREAVIRANTGRKQTAEDRQKKSLSHTGKHVGENNNFAKLTIEVVVAIKRGLVDGMAGRALANKFGVSEQNISAIKHGRSWSHVVI